MKLLLLLILSFSFLSASEESQAQEAIRSILLKGGMPEAKASRADIQFVSEFVYRLTIDENIYFLKLMDKAGARGDFSLKFLIPTDSEFAHYLISRNRRKWGRAVLEDVRHTRESLVPLPLSFALLPPSEDPLGVFEVFVFSEESEDSFPSKFLGLVATLWEGLRLTPIESEGDPSEPLDYSPETLATITETYGEFQYTCARELVESIESLNLSSASQIEDLFHPEKSLEVWDSLITSFLAPFGFINIDSLDDLAVDFRDPDSRAFKKLLLALNKTEASIYKSLEIIRDALLLPYSNQSLSVSLLEVEEAFLALAPSQETEIGLSLNQMAFFGEESKQWSEEDIFISKAIIQLKESHHFVNWVRENPFEFADFIEKLAAFQPSYEKLYELSIGVVLHSAHPTNFLTNNRDGRLTLLDFENLSLGVEIADLASVYFYKILSQGIKKNLRAIDLLPALEAVIEGYEKGRRTRLSNEVIALFPVYTAALHLRHLSQLTGILDPNFESLNTVNQAFSFSLFLEEWNELLLAIDLLDRLI